MLKRYETKGLIKGLPIHEEDYVRVLFEVDASGRELRDGTMAYINGGGERDVKGVSAEFTERVRILLSTEDPVKREENAAFLEALFAEYNSKLAARIGEQQPIRTDETLCRSRIISK